MAANPNETMTVRYNFATSLLVVSAVKAMQRDDII